MQTQSDQVSSYIGGHHHPDIDESILLTPKIG